MYLGRGKPEKKLRANFNVKMHCILHPCHYPLIVESTPVLAVFCKIHYSALMLDTHKILWKPQERALERGKTPLYFCGGL